MYDHGRDYACNWWFPQAAGGDSSEGEGGDSDQDAGGSAAAKGGNSKEGGEEEGNEESKKKKPLTKKEQRRLDEQARVEREQLQVNAYFPYLHTFRTLSENQQYQYKKFFATLNLCVPREIAVDNGKEKPCLLFVSLCYFPVAAFELTEPFLRVRVFLPPDQHP